MEGYREEDIDLRVYIDILLRWWWLPVLLATVAGFAAFVVTSLPPTLYEATAGVVSMRSRAEISLGSGFDTITEDDPNQVSGQIIATSNMERTYLRMNTLVGLVHSGAVAQTVSAELEGVLPDEEREPSALIDRISAQVLELEGSNESSDTIQITAIHEDPAMAAAIANTWARAYADYVNMVYGETTYAPFVDIEEQVADARAEYDARQEALLTFLTEDDRISELDRQIAEEEMIVSKLREARQADDVANRLLVLKVFELERGDLVKNITRDWDRKSELVGLTQEAALMREQLVRGGEASAQSSGLALLAFKSRIFSTADGLPFDTLDIQAPSIDALSPGRTAGEQIADLDALIATMEEEVATLKASITEQSEALLAGEGYDFLAELSPEQPTLSSGTMQSPLSKEIADREMMIRSLQAELARLKQVRIDLQEARDLAWRAYSSLRPIAQEMSIASTAERSEVRFASPALPPSKPVSRGRLQSTALAMVVGFMLGVGGAFLFDYIGMDSSPQVLWGQLVHVGQGSSTLTVPTRQKTDAAPAEDTTDAPTAPTPEAPPEDGGKA